MDRTPDYSNYSLEELYEAYRSIDKERYKDRALTILKEIKKRESENPLQETNPQSQKKLWLERAKAFLLDYLLFITIWIVIDNLIFIPVPHFLISLLSVILFCAYFALTEGRNPLNISPGKRIMNLQIISHDGAPPSQKTVIFRAAIIAALLVFDWETLFSSLPVPGIIMILAATIPIGFIFYNIWLAIKSPAGRMLQDYLTKTEVVFSPATARNPINAPETAEKNYQRTPDKDIGFAIIIITILAFTLFTDSISSAAGTGSIWDFPDSSTQTINTTLENTVVNELNLRTRIEVTTHLTKRFSTGSKSGAEKTLEVSIWIPATHFQQSTRERIMNSVLENITVTPGFYDAGTVIVWTGGEYLYWEYSFDLTLP